MTRKTQQTSNPPPPRGLEGFASATDSNLGAYTAATQAMLKGVAAFNDEMMSFANARIEENMKASQALMNCDHLGGALQLQLDSARGATEQYLAEAGKLADIATKITSDCWTPLQNRAQEMAQEAEEAQAEATGEPEEAEAPAKTKEVAAAAE